MKLFLFLIFMAGDLYYLFFILARAGFQNAKVGIAVQRETDLGRMLNLLGFLGLQVLPLVYPLVPFVNRLDFPVPDWLRLILGILGAGILFISLRILRNTHELMKQNWSGGVEIQETHELVTGGYFRFVRHPIYAAFFLWGIAQVFLLPNLLVGMIGLVFHTPNHIYRARREEAMLLDRYGVEYQEYMKSTPRIIPTQFLSCGKRKIK